MNKQKKNIKILKAYFRYKIKQQNKYKYKNKYINKQ